MATMRMYCPSLKENVEATITDGKQVASKGGSLRNILYGEYEGRKCLPKTVKAEVFAQHGFAAESNFDKLSHEIAEEYEEKGKTPEEAQEIGDATAAKIGRMKYGKKGMERKSLKGKEAETFEDDEEEEEEDWEYDVYVSDSPDSFGDVVEDMFDTAEEAIEEAHKISNDARGKGKRVCVVAIDDVQGGEKLIYEITKDGEQRRFDAETFEAYDDPISDRQEWKINSLGGTVDSSMNRSEASDYIKELQGRKSGTWKEAESSPSSFDISWEDAQGVSSPSLPPEGIHFAEGEDYNLNAEFTVAMDSTKVSGFEISEPQIQERNMTDDELEEYALKSIKEGYGPDYWVDDGGDEKTIRITEIKRHQPYEPDFESEYNLNGENCDYCAETRELNAEGFCSECAHHADYFNARSYEDAFRSESVSYASEGLTRNGKFALGLTALGVGIAMAMGSEKVASLLDKINRK